jgi:cobalt-zinc-cadmium efflux system protein
MSEQDDLHHFHDDHHHHEYLHHKHHHGLVTDPDANTLKLTLAGIFQVVYVLALGVIGLFYAHSAALTSDAAHVLVDAIVSFSSVVVIRRSNRPATDRATFGFKRLQVRMAEWNGLLFFVLAALLTMTAVQRLIHPGHVKGLEVVLTGLISLPLSGLVFWLSHSASEEHAHHHHGKKSAARFAQELHALNDLVGVILAIIGGAIIWIWGFERADAIATLVVVYSMVHHGIEQLKQTGWILLEQAPPSIEIEVLRSEILELPDVLEIAELHVWCISEELTSMNIRIVAADNCKCHRLERLVSHIAKHNHDIGLTTVQVIHSEDLHHTH